MTGRGDIIDQGPEIVEHARRVVAECTVVCEAARDVAVTTRRIIESSEEQRAERVSARSLRQGLLSR